MTNSNQQGEQKQNDLGHAPIGSLLLRLATPAICAQLINALYNIVDRIYIGHMPDVGKVALTGVGVTFPLIMLISAFSALVGMGGAPLASIASGQGDSQRSARIMGNCLTLLLCISAVLMGLFFLFREPLIYLLGASPETAGYALDYINIYVLGTVFVQLALGLNSFITAQGFATTSMLTVLLGAVLNIALDPLFIYGFHMGVQGAATATVLSQAVSAMWVLRFLTGPKTGWRLRLQNMRPQKAILLAVISLGISPFIMQSTESLLNIVLNSSLQSYGGDTAVGAMTVIGSVMQFIMLPLSGLAQGAQPITSFNYGAGNLPRVRRTFKLLLTSSLCYTFAAWAVVMLLPAWLVRIFNSDPELIDFTVWAMRIYMAVAFLTGAQIACQQTFLALGQAKISMFLALLRKMLLLIPLILILPRLFGLGVTGIFLASPLSDTIAVSTTVLMFWRKSRRLLYPTGS